MSDEHPAAQNERLTKVETQVIAMNNELTGISKTLRDIQDAVNKGQKTDWTVFLMALALIGTLWAAAIHPIAADIERSNKASERLAEAVIVQNDKASEERIERLKADAEADKRLALIEFQLTHPDRNHYQP